MTRSGHMLAHNGQNENQPKPDEASDLVRRNVRCPRLTFLVPSSVLVISRNIEPFYTTINFIATVKQPVRKVVRQNVLEARRQFVVRWQEGKYLINFLPTEVMNVWQHSSLLCLTCWLQWGSFGFIGESLGGRLEVPCVCVPITWCLHTSYDSIKLKNVFGADAPRHPPVFSEGRREVRWGPPFKLGVRNRGF